jgi:putative transposase
MCTAAGLCIFGDIIGHEMVPNEFGGIVYSVWNELSHHYPGITPMTFVVMPNHVHGIVHVGAQFIAPSNNIESSNGIDPPNISVSPNGIFPPNITVCDIQGRDESRPYGGHGLDSSDRGGIPTAKESRPYGGHRHDTVTVGKIVRGFKARCTRLINLSRQTPTVPVWQRNYHDHIIRDAASYLKIVQYIETNPQRWQEDPHYV